MAATQTISLAAAGQAALDALHAENRASAARLRACYALHQLCVDEQTARDIEAGHFDPDLYPDAPGPGPRPTHAEIDPHDIACAELVARYGVHHHRASALLKLAVDMTERFPAMLTEMESGWLDERTASMLARHMRTVDSSVLFAAQRAVLDWLRDAIAAGNRPGRDTILARTDRIVHDLDPAGVLARRRAALRERHVSVRRRPDGMADLTAHLSSAEASAISSVLDQEAQATLAREKAARIADARSGGSSNDSAHDDTAAPFLGERTHGERRADALVDALLGSGPGAEAGDEACACRDGGPQVRPSVTVLAPLGPDGEPEAYFPRSGPASIDALIALLSRSVGAGISLIDPAPGAGDTVQGRRRYRISPALARRVRLRDGTCRHPGCSEPAENCDIDHAHPFDHSDPARGGPTAEANLMCLCRRHHRFKTFHTWWYRLAPDGTLTVTTESGHTLTTSPSGPLSLWRERFGDPPGPMGDAPEARDEGKTPAARPWLKPGPRSTDWHRRSCRVAAERRRNIEAMLEELLEQARRSYEDPGHDSSNPNDPADHAGPGGAVDPDPPPF